MRFDAAIVGLGVMGSASTYALAKRGLRVVAFDQLTPPHSSGSSHGHTRIIREAYYEHPLYVPLVRRAYELWAELEQAGQTRLMVQTGGLMVGPESGALVRGALQSARTHRIPHEMLDTRAVTDRFPAYRAPDGWVGLLEHRAGMLFPERCIEALLGGAKRHAAHVLVKTAVVSWTHTAGGVTLATDAGQYDADRLVVAAGPWLPTFGKALGVRIPLEIERQLSHWFEPRTPDDARYTASRCPIGLWDVGDVFATLPDEGNGVKCGMHHAGAPTSAAEVERSVSAAENEAARLLLEQVMPGAGGRLLDSRVCLYTNTPDRHFIIDWLPHTAGRVLIVSPCSGHGFKFASAIGEIVSQLIMDDRSWMDLAPFSLSRFR